MAGSGLAVFQSSLVLIKLTGSQYYPMLSDDLSDGSLSVLDVFVYPIKLWRLIIRRYQYFMQ